MSVFGRNLPNLMFKSSREVVTKKQIMRKDKTWIYMFLIGMIIIFLFGMSLYESLILKRDGVYAVTHEFKKIRGTKSGVTYGYIFTTEFGDEISGEYFKPITDKNAEIREYYVVYSRSDPTINILLENKECCENKNEVIYKRISKREWSIFDF